MKRYTIAVMGALAAMVAAPLASAQAPLSLEQKKAVVIQFYNALNRGDPDTLLALGRSDYRQHNPNFADGIMGLVDAVRARPPRPAGSVQPLEFVRVIAEGDYVMTLRRMTPPPGSPEGAVRANVDIFRVQDGKVAEHWDYQETFPRGTNPPKNGNGPF